MSNPTNPALRRLSLAPVAAAAFTLFAWAGAANATVIVTSFDAAYTSNGNWYQSNTASGGTVGTVNLTGQGGNLENNQPIGPGAAKVTTNNTDASAAEVAVRDSYGTAGNILSSLKVHYAYYKEAVAAPNANVFAAPSLKLSFFNPTYAATPGNDGFVTLIYEQYWQTGTPTPTPGSWTTADIDFDNGLFWGNGGFGVASGAGGPPLRTLSGWLAAFNSAFGDAQLTTLSVGVGTYNQSQIGYFDDVQISHRFGNGYSASYNFEAAAAAVPEPGTLALVGLALLGVTTLASSTHRPPVRS